MGTENAVYYLDIYDENGLFSSFEDLGFCWRRILTTKVLEQAQELADVLGDVLDKDCIEISANLNRTGIDVRREER